MPEKLTGDAVRGDFNDIRAVLHYTRAAHDLGLWKSERILIERFFPDRGSRLLDAGCGAGRVTLGLWDLGYRNLAGFDFSSELIEQARSLAQKRSAGAITFLEADATDPGKAGDLRPGSFDGALFMFNGLMQIPGREHRRRALVGLNRLCVPGALLMFTTHDRDESPTQQLLWKGEARRWAESKQDPRLVEFGDRYFEDESGRTFMHLPVREEILDDLAASGWEPVFDSMRAEIARESNDVRKFSDECRFWVARRRQPAT